MLEVARRTQSIELDLFAALARTHFEFAFPQQVGVKSRLVGFAANEFQDAGPGRKRNALLALPFERNKKLGAARSGHGIDQNKIDAPAAQFLAADAKTHLGVGMGLPKLAQDFAQFGMRRRTDARQPEPGSQTVGLTLKTEIEKLGDVE